MKRFLHTLTALFLSTILASANPFGPLVLAGSTAGGGGGGAYHPNTAYFAGDTQCWLQHNTPWAASANALYFSFWLKPDSSSGTTAYIWGAGDDGIRIRLNTSDQILFTCEDAASTVLIQATSTAAVTRNATAWTHVFIRLDRTVDDQIEIYINGTEGHSATTFLSTTEDSDPIDMDAATSFGSSFGSEDYEGCIADFWASAGNTYANVTISDFYNAGAAVDLGTTGTNPDGTQPRHFLKGSGTGFTVNSGSGGNWTKQGTTALTTCSTAP